jgi:hypothetical protein
MVLLLTFTRSKNVLENRGWDRCDCIYVLEVSWLYCCRRLHFYDKRYAQVSLGGSNDPDAYR